MNQMSPARAVPAPPDGAPASQLTGLTEQQVAERRRAGQGNNVAPATSRTYRDIIVTNVLNPINLILFAIGAVMIAIGRTGDAISGVGLILFNVVVGAFQEIRAKRQLDHIALLTRPKITVLRDGREQVLDPSALVLGDVIVVRPGDQLVVDGAVVGDGAVDLDESLLTGESDLVTKTAGAEVLSGSFCAGGTALVEATRVGNDSYANKLTTTARKFEVARTPLQRDVNFILRLLVLLAAFLGGVEGLGAILERMPLMRQLQMASIIAGLIPNGLMVMVVLAYALGALRIVRRGALVQQSNAVESLSNVTVLCTDKTGTLTANRITYHDVYPIGLTKDELERRLGHFARSTTVTSKTSEALVAALPGTAQPRTDEVPFASSRKWSAIACESGPLQGVTALGAWEMLQPYVTADNEALRELHAWSERGLRVLVFAGNPAVTRLHDATGAPVLPALQLLGLLSFRDELRPHLQDTLSQFASANVDLKIISGDSPATVAALARQAGLPGEPRTVSGPELAAMSPAEFREAAAEAAIFGRIVPEQKEQLVNALQAQGQYVAMMGDGVNDVLSVKHANLGIAMESGSAATRAVADMVLLGDSFEALPPAFREGQRIVNGMNDILSLFLTRILYAALLIIAVSIVDVGFPFVPKHNTLFVLLTVGLPTLLLAVWARPGHLSRRTLNRQIAHFVIPAAVTIFVFGLAAYLAAFYYASAEVSASNVTPEAMAAFIRYTGINYPVVTHEAFRFEFAQWVAQTALTAFLSFAGLLLIVFVEPPIPWFTGGDSLSPDRRPTWMAGALLLVFAVIVSVEPLRAVFELAPLPWEGYLALAGLTLVWMLVVRLAWRHKWLERFLETDL